MAVRTYRSQITHVHVMPGGTYLIRMRPQASFKFEPGQFVSVKIRTGDGPEDYYWRPYSFANSHRDSMVNGVELCIRPTEGGNSWKYLSSLRSGEWIEIRGPYGDFALTTHESRGVCFIATGTGIAPFRSMVLSDEFHKKNYGFKHAVLGFKKLEEVPYMGDFEKNTVKTIYALSQDQGWSLNELNIETFPGRVTEYLKSLPNDYPWPFVDFYLCGNHAMIQDVTRFLASKGVPAESIHSESFSVPMATAIAKRSG